MPSNLHSGGWTAGTLLVPYSVLVESMSQYLNSMNAGSGGAGGAGDNGQLRMFAAAAATSVVASMGVQPIEKKLTMDQMLESENARRAVAARYPGKPNPLLTPLREIAAYTQAEGAAALFGGFLPLCVTAQAFAAPLCPALPARLPTSRVLAQEPTLASAGLLPSCGDCGSTTLLW